MTVAAPTTTERLRQCAAEIGLGPTAADTASFVAPMAPSVAAYDAQGAWPENQPPMKPITLLGTCVCRHRVDEPAIYRAAYVFGRAEDWRQS